MGPAHPSCKENGATETRTRHETNTSVLEETWPGLPGRMTCCGESRKQAIMSMTLLSTRTTLNIGTWDVRTMYEAGKRFVNTCAANNIVIGGSVFPHKIIHKATWVSPAQVTEKQIDHIGINKMFRRSLQDVRVKRGADVASDHHLETARLKLKLRRNEVDQERRK